MSDWILIDQSWLHNILIVLNTTELFALKELILCYLNFMSTSNFLKYHNIGYIQETHFKYKDINRLTVNGWKRIYHANTNQKESWRERKDSSSLQVNYS